ncbi:MAG: hydrogenase 4 subunit F, partial [Alistipes sp.]|nr:hydrogenase 4 subunit F [Alistipes sp.]
MLTYIIVSLLIAIAPLASRSERVTNLIASLFALVQVASVALLFVFDRFDTALLTIFRTDTLAVVFHVLMIAVLIFSLIHSSSYLRAEKVTTRSYNAYYTLLMLLALSITCVYYSYNLAMTWVFLELTTICSAGI